MSTNRPVGVTLRTQVSEWQAGFLSAAKSTRELGSEVDRLSQKKQDFETLGRTALVAGGLMAAGAGLAISKFAEFDQAMSNVIATGSDAAENQEELRDAALEAGAATVYSATESANAIEELAKAGISASDVLNGALTGSLDLAAAGNLDVARAAEIAATTLQQFQLDGEDASHVADLLAAGAGKAMGEVEDMAQALNQAGLVSNQFGISVEETVGTLSAFASAGMLGSDAGTSMRTMLLRLANPTKEVQTLMKDLGFEAYNSQGQFIGLAGLAGELETSLEGMTDAQRDQTLAMIFGQDAIRGANILLREGKDGIQEWTDTVDDQGYAADVAAKRLDNLRGDVEALGGAVDTALIQMGSAADGPGRFFVQWLGGMVDDFTELPGFAQQSLFWIGAVGGAAAIAGGTFFTAVPKIAEFNAALEGMPPKVQRVAGVLRGVAGVLGVFAAAGAAVAGIEAVGDALRGVEATSTELQNTLTKGSLDDALAKSVQGTAFPWEVDRVKETMQDLGGVLQQVREGRPSSNSTDPIDIYFDQLSASVTNLGDALAGVKGVDLTRTLEAMRSAYNLTEDDILTLINSSTSLRESLIGQADSMGLAGDDATLLGIALGTIKPPADAATEAADQNAAALAALEGQAGDAKDEIEGLADAIRGFASTTLSVRDAERGFEQALDDLTESVEGNGNSLDRASQAGRDNEAALDGIARAALDMAAATLEQTNSEEDAAAALRRGRDGLIEKLDAFGITGQAAEDYADKLGLIPENIPTYVDLQTGDAESKLAWLTNPNRFRINIPVFTESMGPIAGTGTVLKPSANGNLFEYEQAMTRAFAEGGSVETGIYAGRPAAIHKFAEQETVWEAFISGKPDQRERNIGIAHESLERLGAPATGGVTITFGDIVVPEGLSVAEIRSEIRNTVRQQMQPIADAVRTGRA